MITSKILLLILKILTIASCALLLFSLAVLPIIGEVYFFGVFLFAFLGAISSGIIIKSNPKQQIWKLFFAVHLLFSVMSVLIVILALINQ